MTTKEVKPVATETWVRTIALGVTMLNQLLVSFHRNPLPWSDTDVYTYLSLTATVLVSAWTYWKNNSWTPAAIKADEVLHKEQAKELLQDT